MFHNVIFDLDGTLLDTIDDLADAGNYVCRLHGWPTYTVEEYKRFVGNGMAKLVSRFVPEEWRTPEGVAAILEEFMPYYDAHKEDKTAPYTGLPEVVRMLKEAGVSMSVLTNKADELAGPVVESYYPVSFLSSREPFPVMSPSRTLPCSKGLWSGWEQRGEIPCSLGTATWISVPRKTVA